MPTSDPSASPSGCSCVRRTNFAAETRMKRTPTLTFHYDPTVESGMRISRLLEDEGEAE